MRWRGSRGDGKPCGADSLRAHYEDLERWCPTGTTGYYGEPVVTLTERERRLHKARIMRAHFVQEAGSRE